ncbi:MAG: hypothetical protein ACRDBL_08125 [Rhabdaerophilum sp.]
MVETEPPALRAEIDALLAEYEGNARAVIAALLHDIAVLASDAESRTSRGYVRGNFVRPKSRKVTGTSRG